MGNGQSATTLAALHHDMGGNVKKRSLSANVSPRKSKHTEPYSPLETLDDTITLIQTPKPLSPGGRKSLELSMSPRQQKSLQCHRNSKVSTTSGHSERSPSVSSSNSQNIAPDFKRKPSAPCQRRRMSIDEHSVHSLQLRRLSRTGKLSLASREDIMSARRVSRAAIHFTETGDFGLTLVEQLKLTSYQSLILQQTWPKIKHTILAPVFKQLSSRNVKAKELFQKMSILEGFSTSKCCDMKEHVRCLIELFDCAINDMNKASKLIQDKCTAIGEVHYAICGGSASGIWDDLGNCLTETISRTEAIRGKREGLKAWISLISFLMDSMRGGYMAQCKRKSISRPMASLNISGNPEAASGCPHIDGNE